MDMNSIIIMSVAIVIVIIVFFIVVNMMKARQTKSVSALEDEIYNLKAKIQDQEKIIKHATNSSKGRLALDQIKKIEALEAEIQQQKKRVQNAQALTQEAYRVKSEFLSNIRHEIRTPMNSIIVFAELLLQEKNQKKMNNYAKNIYGAGKKLLEMIEDIIELSEVESGAFTLEETPVDVKSIIAKIVKFHREEAMRKGLEFTLDIDDNLPDSLMLDASKIEDIFTNLIENAVKFTESGFVHVQLVQNGKDIVKNAINFSLIVDDSGVGVAEENRKKIFEIFEQGSEQEKPAGTGLGLAINKKMASQMHGDIFLEHKQGPGAKFVFSIKGVEIVLPSAVSQEDNADMIDFSLVKPEGGATIMVIDQSSEVRNLIRDAFFETAIKVLSFDNPRDAIEMLKTTKANMILIDIDMLTSDNNAVSKILKGISNAPVVTLTQKQMRDIKIMPSSTNIAGHLKKPLLKSELFKISLQLLNNVTESSHAMITQREEEFYQMSVKQKNCFFTRASHQLDSLYSEASATNDLATIKFFAQELLDVALACNIKEFVTFADELLVKINLFEIDEINTMLQQYRQKISQLKNSVV